MSGYASLTLHQYRRLQTRALRSERAAVFRIREGSKKMALGGQQAEFSESQLGLIAPRAPLDIENRPGPRGVYKASAIALPDGIAESFSGCESNPLGRSAARHAGDSFNRAESLLQDPATPAAVKDHAAREVLLWLAEDGIVFPPPPPKGLEDRLRAMISADPAAGWKADQAAATLALSPATLRRRLAGEGVSFSEVLGDVRMIHALTLLQATSFPIARVAEECGYASPSRFAARFRARFGCAPAAIRAPAIERTGTEVERSGTA